jgi:hypothetical protein
VLIVLAAWLLALAAPAAANPILMNGVARMGGSDLDSDYTASSGVLTFGSGSDLGNVTSTWLQTADVSFDVVLDLSGGFNPATDYALNATFVGASEGPDFVIYEPLNSSVVALGFEVNFIEVTAVRTHQMFTRPGGEIQLGQAEVFQATSRLVLTEGSALNSVLQAGSEAWLRVVLRSLDPSLTTAGGPGYLGSDFQGGITGPPVSTSQWAIVIEPIPEPGTAMLLGLGLLTLVATARRSARR